MTTDYLTPDEVASRLQVSRQVVYNWINDGRLSAVKAGRNLRVQDYALEAFLQPVHSGEISTGGIEPEGSIHSDRFTATAQAAADAANGEVRTRLLIDMRATQHAPAPQATAHGQAEWDQRIEQQLARIETELAAIRAMLNQRTSTNTA